MPDHPQWTVVLVCPGEEELTLLAHLSARRNTRIVAICDPDGMSVGAQLAEIMGLPVIGSLNELLPGEAQYLVHPPRNEVIAPFVDQAGDFGLEPIPAHRFTARMDMAAFKEKPAKPVSEAGGSELGFLEEETASIHRTLSRIEEALDGQTLLRWLLGLATRATGASSGSILLFDEAAEELYLGFAYGLSQHTMHRTRIKLGEGIAGQVALTRQGQWVRDHYTSENRRDRSAIQSAVCCPLTWEGVLLGVLNVSSDQGEADLNSKALETIESLTHRFGMILNRFLKLQNVVNGDVFRELDENFALAQADSADLGEILNIWLEDLQRVCGADETKLTLLTGDGDLLVADHETLSYPQATGSGIAEILVTGLPLVQAPDNGPDAQENGGSTIFHLPVGRDPVTAVLTCRFTSAATAHHFHRISGEILYLLNKHLSGILENARLRDQIHRLTALAGILSEIRLGNDPYTPETEERILAAARELTGAQQAFLLFAPLDEEPKQSAAGSDSKLFEVADDLLEQASQRGHLASVMTLVNDPVMGIPRSVLAVPLQAGHAYPGLVLFDKKRLQPLDGKTFTEFDAVFARRLAPMFAWEGAASKRPAQTVEIIPSLTPDPAALRPYDRAIEDILRREMDRCDRYHNMLGLAGFRLDPGQVPVDQIPILVQNLTHHLRSSDIAGCLEDGTILVLVPEDIQSLPRLKNRVHELLKQLTSNNGLQVNTATRAYPGGGDTSQKLLDSLLAALH